MIGQVAHFTGKSALHPALKPVEVRRGTCRRNTGQIESNSCR
jgi:hypothetical protein